MTQSTWSFAEERGALLLAVDARLSSVEMTAYAIVVVGAIILVGVGIWVVSRLVHRRRFNSHAGLYHALCHAHDLGRSERSLLAQVARYHGLAQPGRLFTDPNLLDPRRLAKVFGDRTEELAQLHAQLFAEPKPERDAPPAEASSRAAK